ncbi:hypothetical protein SYK_23510 [Pseudodesulfovibrio nedwellii]|uniref:Lipoprotein n=1 Tax=Pseudodesulfovibrio nedwellii TaxID=2973072 RepID=A0ABM8B2E4_9BACT|nr:MULTISPECIES: hypothetical protein [Pseudodesulfovibrio]BDQ37991.1 hypothetical protein SYK_23510 [Pseudodesulfovibrio nedwellii]
MRTIIIALMLVLTLAACGTKDDSVESPMPDAEAAEQTATPAPVPSSNDQNLKSTNTLKDEIPDGPVGTLQLADGSTIVISELIKLDKYYLYMSGKLNGRSSTVVSFTRFTDFMKFEAFIFKDQHNFIVTTKKGKELIFMDARIYLGSDSADTYSFYTVDDNLDRQLVTVKKSNVATIKLH